VSGRIEEKGRECESGDIFRGVLMRGEEPSSPYTSHSRSQGELREEQP
jgi:hypothetical protein